MNWKHGLYEVEEDGDEEGDDDDGDDEDDDEDEDEDGDKGDEHESNQDDDKERLVDRGSRKNQFSFERETRCNKRFPRRRGRLDKAEEAE
ncbi:hypothetical protein ANTRET_LOCUS10246 [Anthophora retusa]